MQCTKVPIVWYCFTPGSIILDSMLFSVHEQCVVINTLALLLSTNLYFKCTAPRYSRDAQRHNQGASLCPLVVACPCVCIWFGLACVRLRASSMWYWLAVHSPIGALSWFCSLILNMRHMIETSFLRRLLDRVLSLLMFLAAITLAYRILRDVIGQCDMVALPPMYFFACYRQGAALKWRIEYVLARCTQAFFWNYGLLPPQYVSFNEGSPYPKKCVQIFCCISLSVLVFH